MKPFTFSVALLVTLLPLAPLSVAETNRYALTEKPESPRFEVKDIQWPAEVGQADICLWKDDKLAAVSLGVDDNFGGEIDWWKEKCAEYDIKMTWFVITGRVDSGQVQWGTWDQYRELHTLGHGVESHTVTHLHAEEPDWGGIEWEYKLSKEHLEQNIPGNKVATLAYPGGKNSGLNDREVAAKFYRTARGTTGTPNAANMIDYYSVNAMSNWNLGGEKAIWADLNNVLSPELNAGRHYRGWAFPFCHGMSKIEPKVIETLEWIRTHRDKLWVGLYADVARYGQQRDTATLTMATAGPQGIEFQLTDEMDNEYFNTPLTVKVRIPNEWADVQATQDGQSIAARMLEHEGNKYALVDSVPDAGKTSLTAK